MSNSSAASLLDLQGIDVEIIRARKRLEELPEKTAILELRVKIKEIAALGGKASMLLRKLEAELKARQDEISSLTSKIEGEQGKIMSTTDHRQIQALTREMDGLKRRSDKLEMESLQYMERIEKATEQLTTIKEHEAKLRERDASLVEQYKAAGTAIQKEIGALEAKRGQVGDRVDPQMLTRYETIRDSKGGVGVGRLEGDSCSACRMTLPAERVRELTSGPDIGVCPQCRRLVVVRIEGDE